MHLPAAIQPLYRNLACEWSGARQASRGARTPPSSLKSKAEPSARVASPTQAGAHHIRLYPTLSQLESQAPNFAQLLAGLLLLHPCSSPIEALL
jgi:hypothetical protein